MSVRIIAELGSCHMGKMAYLKEAVDRCAQLKVDALKLQLFPNEKKFTESGNVWLSREQYLEIAEYARGRMVLSASCFDDDSFEFLLKTAPPFIKFSYSQKHRSDWIQETIAHGIEPIVSCDVMSDQKVPEAATKLFCISQYPVYWQIRFDTLFPRFDGFSDHTLGFDQTLEALYEGAQLIEKHFKLDHPDVTCPDSYFALSPYELSAMTASIRHIENKGAL